MGTVYLLHFEWPYYHARHYLGFVNGQEALAARLERHRKGNGARLLEVITKAGISFECVRVWENKDRNFERLLKKRKNSKRLCPICKSEKTLFGIDDGSRGD